MGTTEQHTLTDAQASAIATGYTGTITRVERLDDEPSTPRFGMYAALVTLSDGWVVKVGQHGAVLSEERMSTASTLAKAMIDLGRETITADDFRAIMRANRDARGDEQHERDKFGACAILENARA